MEPDIYILLNMARRSKRENRVLSEELESLFHANRERLIDHICRNFNQESAESLQYFQVLSNR